MTSGPQPRVSDAQIVQQIEDQASMIMAPTKEEIIDQMLDLAEQQTGSEIMTAARALEGSEIKTSRKRV